MADDLQSSNEHLRFYVMTRGKLGKSATKIHQELQTAYTEHSPGYSTIARWLADFQAGRTSLSDAPRSGRPNTAVTDQNIGRVQQLVFEDPHCTIEDLCSRVPISHDRVHSILHNELHLRKICARWVPHRLTAEQKQVRMDACAEILHKFSKRNAGNLEYVITGDEKWFHEYQVPNKQHNKSWLCPNDPRPTITRTAQTSRKHMFVIFFGASGAVSKICLPHGQTVNAHFYRDECLSTVVHYVNQHEPGASAIHCRGHQWFLHHDNASSHTARLVVQYLEENKLEIIKHPPYSPDVAPCDFWLFPTLQEMLAGEKFENVQGLSQAIAAGLRRIPSQDYRTAFEKWLHRCQLVISHHGDYIEGLSC